MIKIGLGQDSHPFDKEKDKPLTLGGIVFADLTGLKGNSDGDAILHSICNALSSAIGGDSLGTWSDDMCLKKGISDSTIYLAHVFNRVKRLGYSVGNISIAIEMKVPRIALLDIQRIKKRVAELLYIESNCVGITITSGEALTAFGEGQGIQVFSTVLINSND